MHFYLFIICVGAGVCILVGGTHVGGQNLGQSEANLRSQSIAPRESWSFFSF